MKITRRRFITTMAGGCTLLSAGALSARPRPEPVWKPGYLKLEEAGRLAARVKDFQAQLDRCLLCPRACGVNRRRGERGVCQAPGQAVVFSASPHFGEEKPIVGSNGSGTIFFSHCNLRCLFCQNWPIAHEGRGETVTDEKLAGLMLQLQRIGCHNINLVTPTHMVPFIINATRIALKQGLRVPLFYNTSGYESLETLRLLNGIVDIYKPDIKFMDPAMAEKYCDGAADYPKVVTRAILEMQRQVGELQLDRRGIALRGLMIRHLVMPNRVAGTEQAIRFIAQNLPKSTYVNIMAQYRVEFRAFEHPEIARGITVEEFLEAIEWAEKYGLTNLDAQSLELSNIYRRLR